MEFSSLAPESVLNEQERARSSGQDYLSHELSGVVVENKSSVNNGLTPVETQAGRGTLLGAVMGTVVGWLGSRRTPPGMNQVDLVVSQGVP